MVAAKRTREGSGMGQHVSEMVDWVMKNAHFDEMWYRETYRDVANLELELNLAPAAHYRRYGSLMQRPPNASFAAEPELLPALRLPAPRSEEELLSAHQIALGGAHDRAVHYARRHLPAKFAHVLNILQANKALANGELHSWLKNLNNYLDHFGLANLQLSQAGSLMAGLSTEALPQVNDGPMVSILMPVWNAEKTVDYAIRSILAQTWRNIELLIVDDASEDGSWEVIQQIAQRDSRVRVYRNAYNVGPFVSKNIALSQVRGEWVTGHDSDDWAHPERIERQVRFCQKLNASACTSGMLRMAANGQFVRINKASGFFYDGACRSAFISLMVHAQFLHDHLGFWDTVRMGGDSEFLRRVEHVTGRPVPDLQTVTMLCLDNPEGLTNHPELGHSEIAGVSPFRKIYKKNFIKRHAKMKAFDSRLPFPHETRRFTAPKEMLNEAGRVDELISAYERQGTFIRRDIASDVTLITDLRFPGGNASSSMDEVAFLEAQGHSVSIVHCPIDVHFGKPISDRYRTFKDRITNWSRVGNIASKVVICRHPVVASSYAFKQIAPRISAANAFFVINNSYLRENGQEVYSRGALIKLSRRLKANQVTFCPISPAIRAELEEAARDTNEEIRLATVDWTPTFNLSHYHDAPKPRMIAPFRIGRHGRDAPEKWHEDPEQLLQAYPNNKDFINVILGGAAQARRSLGALPENWLVHEFGKVEPREYLRNLDAFVYFPHSARIEAFGRTIAEAMFAGVPVILPRNFESTFDDLPIYADPSQVEYIVRSLAVDDEARLAYLIEVQKIAVARYSSKAIANRMIGTHLNFETTIEDTLKLSSRSLAYKRTVTDANMNTYNKSSSQIGLAKV